MVVFFVVADLAFQERCQIEKRTGVRFIGSESSLSLSSSWTQESGPTSETGENFTKTGPGVCRALSRGGPFGSFSVEQSNV
ncbi:MAG: hypothetical protein COT73_10230 [Bdellovibrio sp. CG10_big_fil_rev_8_21_14_0_10_47_8]|nr:MAG: hypothetical protein COT73_10230 [Bdellovibrio sp. CG10_big_fil_rev_8_21_14_0_10_47_8]